MNIFFRLIMNIFEAIFEQDVKKRQAKPPQRQFRSLEDLLQAMQEQANPTPAPPPLPVEAKPKPPAPRQPETQHEPVIMASVLKRHTSRISR